MTAVLRTIVFQHAEEASFLWLLRSRAVRAPHYSLGDLSKLDNRLEAHIDGLRISGDDGWNVCCSELSWKEPGEVFVTALLALEGQASDRVEKVLEAGGADMKLNESIISAFGWLTFQKAKTQLNRLCSSESPQPKRIGLAAAAIHRRDLGKPLLDALSSQDADLKARALRAVGELGRYDLVRSVTHNLSADEERVRFSAAWSAALLNGDGLALELLQEFVETGGEFAERALVVAIRRMSLAAAHAWRRKLANNPASIRSAVTCSGAIGDPDLIPWLMSLMPDPKLARVAGEAFTTITGVDIAYEDLDTKAPDNFEAGPNDDPADENVDLDPDENLPWPNLTAIEQWWGKHRHQFKAGERYLLGKPMNSDWLQQVLRIGRQRVRAAAALELAIRNPGQPLFNVAAPGFRQQELLGLRRW